MRRVVTETAFAILFVAGSCDGNTVLVREHFYVEDCLKIWKDARDHCSPSYAGLSVVLSEDDVERVLNSVPGRFTSAWIALRRYTNEKAVVGPWWWSGGQNVDFKNWDDETAESKPYHDCVYTRNGVWYNERCNKPLPFTCYQTYNRMLTVVQEKMSWENALVYCRSKHTDLSSLVSSYTAEKVINGTGVTTEFVWTGLRFLMGAWFWVDGEKKNGDISWSNTSHSQCPAMPLRCGALSVTERAFEARACEEKLNFICYSKI